MAQPTVGIVGAGQLARMTYEAGTRCDVALRVLARAPDEAAAQVFATVDVGAPDDPAALADLAARCDVVTFDHELVDLDLLAALEREGHVLRPSAATLAVATDKRRQREVLGRTGFPVPPHAPVGGPDEIDAFAGDHGWPVVVKAVRGGYDGRGVWTAAERADAETVVSDAARAELELFVEPRLELERELAALVVRRPSGDTLVYPLVETVQVDGICHEVTAPAAIDDGLHDAAGKIAVGIAETIGLVGVLAVELFVVDGQLLVNELAARPHNSGHLTLDGARTSQFENHLRAVLDLPLGPVELTAPAVAMANVLGAERTGDPRERLADALSVEGARVHLYGKQPRPGRKIGHVTVAGDDREGVRARARRAAAILAGPDERTVT